MLMEVDVAIVGGGVIGCAVAHYLSKRGARVVIVERASIGRGASAANSGVISLATKKPGLALDLAIASQRMFPGLRADIDADVEYTVDGGLIIAETETESAFMDDLVAHQREAGAPIEMIDAARVRQLVPMLEGRVLSASFCATDAQANPFKVTQGFARSAQSHGTEILHDTEVLGIETEADRVIGLRTSKGEIRASWIVNAAGAYAPEIGRMVGVEHDVIPRRGQIVVLEATDGIPNVRVSTAATLLAKHSGSAGSINAAFSYTRKSLNGTVLLGGTNEFAGFDTRTTKAALGEICRLAVRAMPAIAGLNALRSWAGLRPYSPKGPQLGSGGGPPGYAIAIGHGGDGVALSPITGLFMSRYIESDGKGCELDAFLEQENACFAANAGAPV
jgi:sarcosine oxidase subunit beta